ncbi:MAG: hypothetical protein ABI131_09630, partial [Nostocoides sp.]
ELADRISVLDGGRIIAEGTPAELKQLVPGGHLLLEFADLADATAARSALGAHGIRGRSDPYAAEDDSSEASLSLRVPSDGSVASLRSVLAELEGQRVEVASLSVHLPDLDDVFLALTGSHHTTEAL